MPRTTTLALALAATLLGAMPAAWAQQQPEVPVMVGGYPDLDACLTNGMVQGLDPAGDNFLAVRGGPAASYVEIDRLHEGDAITLCDEQGEWIGVVYEAGDRAADGYQGCGVGSPIDPRQAYTGSCRSGWVHESFVLPTAG